MLQVVKQLPLCRAQPHLHHLRLQENTVPNGAGDKGEADDEQKIVDFSILMIFSSCVVLNMYRTLSLKRT